MSQQDPNEQEVRIDSMSLGILMDDETALHVDYIFLADVWAKDPRYKSRWMRIGEHRGLFRVDKESQDVSLLRAMNGDEGHKRFMKAAGKCLASGSGSVHHRKLLSSQAGKGRFQPKQAPAVQRIQPSRTRDSLLLLSCSSCQLFMSNDFSDHFWTWYATDEYELVLEACQLMKALDFLQAPASEQSSQIPYCPACETWSEMMLPVSAFLEKVPDDLRSLKRGLSTVWVMCNELPVPAFRCDDYEMFSNPAWEPLRSAAAETLQSVGWDNLQTRADDLIFECRQKLFPGAGREP